MSMSIKIISQVWEKSQQSGSHLLVMLAIANYAHDDGMVWVRGITLGELAKKARLSERQTQRIIAALGEDGEVYAPVVQGRGHTTRYFVTLGFDQEHIKNVLVREYHLSPGEAAASASEIIARQEKVTPMTPFIREKVTSSTRKGDIQGRKGDIQGKKKQQSRASQSTEPDPIRIDPYRSEGSVTRKARTRTPRKKDLIFEILAEVCKIDWTICTHVQRQQLNQTAAILREAGEKKEQTEQQIIDAIRYVAKWYAKHDWRGQKGEAPTPATIREVWKQAIDARPKPAANGHQPREVIPQMSPEEWSARVQRKNGS